MKIYTVIDSDGQHIWGTFTDRAIAEIECQKADRSCGGYGSMGDVWYNIIESEVESNSQETDKNESIEREECKNQYIKLIDSLTDEDFQKYLSSDDAYPDFFYGLHTTLDKLPEIIVREIKKHNRPIEIILYPNDSHGELEFAVDIWHRYESNK